MNSLLPMLIVFAYRNMKQLIIKRSDVFPSFAIRFPSDVQIPKFVRSKKKVIIVNLLA